MAGAPAGAGPGPARAVRAGPYGAYPGTQPTEQLATAAMVTSSLSLLGVVVTAMVIGGVILSGSLG